MPFNLKLNDNRVLTLVNLIPAVSPHPRCNPLQNEFTAPWRLSSLSLSLSLSLCICLKLKGVRINLSFAVCF